jgi:hypothetical protein
MGWPGGLECSKSKRKLFYLPNRTSYVTFSECGGSNMGSWNLSCKGVISKTLHCLGTKNPLEGELYNVHSSEFPSKNFSIEFNLNWFNCSAILTQQNSQLNGNDQNPLFSDEQRKEICILYKNKIYFNFLGSFKYKCPI